MNSPTEIANNYLKIGKSKTALSISKTFLLGIMAGLFIGLGGLAFEIADAAIGGGWGRLVGACLFPGGLAMVLIAGSELFTGNCLLVLPLLNGDIKISGMLKNWLFVYLGNAAGGALLGALIALGHTPSMLNGALLDTILSIGSSKVSLSFGDALVRGILCNVLVCIAVWMAFAAKSVGGKIAGLFFPIAIFIMGGFEHCVANMFYFGAALFSQLVYPAAAGTVTLGAALINNLLPVTIGNIIGGGAVAVIYWFAYLRKEAV